MDEPATAINHVKWAKLIERLLALGVMVRKTRRGAFYLHREKDGHVYRVHLPSGFDPKDPDKLGYVGNFNFLSLCRNLDLEPLKDFAGWYHVM
jgi:hypothetical protein